MQPSAAGVNPIKLAVFRWVDNRVTADRGPGSSGAAILVWRRAPVALPAARGLQ